MIVFILGGATYSEARVGYEVSSDKSPYWEVIVGKKDESLEKLKASFTLGGDTPTLTPEGFLHNIGNFDSVNRTNFG